MHGPSNSLFLRCATGQGSCYPIRDNLVRSRARFLRSYNFFYDMQRNQSSLPNFVTAKQIGSKLQAQGLKEASKKYIYMLEVGARDPGSTQDVPG
jgi:hypothetical protein